MAPSQGESEGRPRPAKASLQTQAPAAGAETASPGGVPGRASPVSPLLVHRRLRAQRPPLSCPPGRASGAGSRAERPCVGEPRSRSWAAGPAGRSRDGRDRHPGREADREAGGHRTPERPRVQRASGTARGREARAAGGQAGLWRGLAAPGPWQAGAALGELAGGPGWPRPGWPGGGRAGGAAGGLGGPLQSEEGQARGLRAQSCNQTGCGHREVGFRGK